MIDGHKYEPAIRSNVCAPLAPLSLLLHSIWPPDAELGDFIKDSYRKRFSRIKIHRCRRLRCRLSLCHALRSPL
jgi:hypothetical protein